MTYELMYVSIRLPIRPEAMASDAARRLVPQVNKVLLFETHLQIPYKQKCQSHFKPTSQPNAATENVVPDIQN